MHLFHIPQFPIQKISVLNGALWDMGQVHCGSSELGMWMHCVCLIGMAVLLDVCRLFHKICTRMCWLCFVFLLCFVVQCDAIITWYNMSWYYTQYCNHSQTLHSQKAPHTSPSWVRYGVSIVRIWRKWTPVIMAPYCNYIIHFLQFPMICLLIFFHRVVLLALGQAKNCPGGADR